MKQRLVWVEAIVLMDILLGVSALSPACGAEDGPRLAEIPWREPGQVKDAAYLRGGALRYTAEGREIVGRNRTCFNNRPLYCPSPHDGVVLAGDRPFVRLLAQTQVCGGFSAAIVRGAEGKWFHDYSEVESHYRCGRMKWRISDTALPGVSVALDAVPLKDAAGLALHLKAKGVKPGDQLIWTWGGAKEYGNIRNAWDPIMRGNPNVCKTGDPIKPELRLGMVPDWCRSNRITIEGSVFRLWAKDGARSVVVGQSDREVRLRVVDASWCASPVKLAALAANELPMVCGIVDLHAGEDEIYFMIAATPVEAVAKRAPADTPWPTSSRSNGSRLTRPIRGSTQRWQPSAIQSTQLAIGIPPSSDTAAWRSTFIFWAGGSSAVRPPLAGMTG